MSDQIKKWVDGYGHPLKLNDHVWHSEIGLCEVVEFSDRTMRLEHIYSGFCTNYRIDNTSKLEYVSEADVIMHILKS